MESKSGAKVTGLPFSTKTQVLIPTDVELKILQRADGQPAQNIKGLSPGLTVGALVYQGKLCLIRPSIATNFKSPPRTYALFDNAIEIWAPASATPAK